MEELLTKLSAVQQQLKAPKGQRNSFGNYNYRSAEDILEAVKPLLFEHGLVMTISDSIVHLGNRYYVEATVTVQNATDSLQATGMAREAENKKGMDEAQITGAASSYARKYALNGMFDIDDTKDADSNEHREQVKNTPTAAPKAPQATPPPKGDEELTRAKKAINEELERQGITAPAAKKAKLMSIIRKSTIDTIDDANIVMDNLEEKAMNNELREYPEGVA